MKKFGLGIPTLNRYDLLQPSLKKYLGDFPDCQIYIVDNGHQNIFTNTERVTLISNQNNVGVGASWNQLCVEIFKKNDYALIINDDIYLGKQQKAIQEHINKGRVFVRATPDWCAFLISKEVYEKVGQFDECFFPAYYEDKSYEYRMKLKGVPILKHPDLNPVEYRSSQTLEKDPQIFEQSKKNKKLYIQMWGGEPTQEKYKTPYNGLHP